MRDPYLIWECWGCLDETEHEQVDDELVCKICRTVNAYLDSDQGESTYYWVQVEHKCEHENFKWIENHWECTDCQEETTETGIDEEMEDGYVTRIPYPVWD
jgi:hypothetical protein